MQLKGTEPEMRLQRRPTCVRIQKITSVMIKQFTKPGIDAAVLNSRRLICGLLRPGDRREGGGDSSRDSSCHGTHTIDRGSIDGSDRSGRHRCRGESGICPSTVIDGLCTDLQDNAGRVRSWLTYTGEHLAHGSKKPPRDAVGVALE